MERKPIETAPLSEAVLVFGEEAIDVAIAIRFTDNPNEWFNIMRGEMKMGGQSFPLLEFTALSWKPL